MVPGSGVAPPRTRSQTCAACGRTFPTRRWARFCGDACRSAHWRRRATNKSPPSVAADAAGEVVGQKQIEQRHLSTIRPDTKLAAVLAELARGRSLNRFEAYRDLHDSVLNSTVCEIERHGIIVARHEEMVPGFRGSKVRCARYWLEPAEREKAAALLGWRTWHAPG